MWLVIVVRERDEEQKKKKKIKKEYLNEMLKNIESLMLVVL